MSAVSCLPATRLEQAQEYYTLRISFYAIDINNDAPTV